MTLCFEIRIILGWIIYLNADIMVGTVHAMPGDIPWHCFFLQNTKAYAQNTAYSSRWC
jgi:hypothetical protein